MHTPSQLSSASGEVLPDSVLAAIRMVLSSALACAGRVLNALHESRRLQAEREIARHRHLIDRIRSRTPAIRSIACS
jgi:hypothetical protein